MKILGVLASAALLAAFPFDPAGASAPASAATSTAAPPGTASLLLTGPTQVALGQALEFDVDLADAPTVAGLEVSVQYDTTGAEFAGVSFGTKDTSPATVGSETGDVVTWISQDPAHGVSFVATTCSLPGCPQGTGNDAVHHARLRIEPQTGGRYTVSIGAVQAVDAHGVRVPISIPTRSVDVDVTGDQVGGPFAAPAAPTVLPEAPGTALGSSSFDQNANGNVGYDDLATMLSAWDAARRTGSCGDAITLATADLEGDGCLDVADLQLLAGSSSTAAPTGRAPRVEVAAGGPAWVVNTDNDLPDTNVGDGICHTSNNDCSLRAAMYEANSSPGPDTINFAIPGGGVHTIQLGAALPVISDTTGGVTINGFTQQGAHPNTDPLVSNAAIMVEIKGQGPMISYNPDVPNFSAFRITSSGNVIQGLSIYAVFDHIEISGTGATGNDVLGNLIGTNVAATYNARDLQEGGSGVKIHSGANHNVVGQPNAADRNVISGTPSTGIRIEHDGTDYNVVQNNIFGLVPAGNAALPNGFSGVDMQFGASFNLVGGVGPMEHNLIDATYYTGVDLSHGENTTENRVVGNYIGTTPDGNSMTSYTRPHQFGISFKDGVLDNHVYNNVIGGAHEYGIYNKQDYTGRNYITDNRIGISLNGTAIGNDKYGMYLQGHDFQVGPGNIFAYNGLAGVYVTSSITVNNKISANTYLGNGGLAIDLAPTGPTPNDPGDADTGPNTLLNYPVVSPANTTQATGTACANCRVEIYKASVDTGNRGEGNRYLGFTTAQSDGTWFAWIDGVAVNDKIAAIAIDATGNTSEFSTVAAVTSVGPPNPNATPPSDPGPGDGGPSGPPAGVDTGPFMPLVPARVLDTRPGSSTVDGLFAGNGLVNANSAVELVVAGRGGVPANASTAVLNVTATEAQGPGYVTVYPCGTRPLASSLNYVAGQTVPNAVLAKIGADGKVCLYTQLATHLLVDVNGYFPVDSSFSSLVPARLMDTRAGSTTVDGLQAGGGPVAAGSITPVTVVGRGGVPADATAVVLNVTATEASGPGYITVFPCGSQPPLASNLNYVGGQTVPNAVIALVGQAGQVCVFSQLATHVVVDVNGYFPPGSAFDPLVPARILDTRPGSATVDGEFAGDGLVPADSTVRLVVGGRGSVPVNATAVVLNVTATEATGPGYVTVFPCGNRPLASNLNYVAGRNIPNTVITGLADDGSVCLYTQLATHLVVDVQGAFRAG